MCDESGKTKALIQNLRDAGCEENLIDKCVQYEQNGQFCAMLCLLSKHRNSLLESVHREQKKLDCLDYLAGQIKAEKCGK
jgi:hypothetical protein